MIIKPVDVTFDLIWRRGIDRHVARDVDEHFDPLAGGDYDAQPFEFDETAPRSTSGRRPARVPLRRGSNTTTAESYIPERRR